MNKNPIEQFSEWLEEAKKEASITEPTAMSLATATKDGSPSLRIVLLKGLDERGFVFYTNLKSRKSAELNQNPQAAACFYWMPLEKQVRIEGKIEAVNDKEADVYFATRPRNSQIGAWASKQSQILPDRNVLLQEISAKNAEFESRPVPRPPFWSGWRIIPERIEFWQQGHFRLHEREIFTRSKNLSGNNWEIAFLYP
jgi:pyridoxamine 5'-phosphate oxidase